jgi:hypothetical protein
MVNGMRYMGPIFLLISIFPGLALAQDNSTQCTYGDMVRRVVIMSEPGVSVPCEVHYYKDTEAPGEDQVLWSASQQQGYCEEQAAGLVTKLEGWGWDCGAAAAPAEPEAPEAPESPESPEAPEAPEAPEDMTEDLAPAPDVTAE